MPHPMPAGVEAYTQDDFARGPFIVFYETTRACDLKCKHCRACAQPNRHPNELNSAQAGLLMDQFASFEKKPLVVLTGGDPMKRDDIFDIVTHAVDLGLQIAMTPSVTPLVTPEAIARLRDAGLSRLAFSLDGVDAATHDAFRGVQGSFDRTLLLIREARRAGLPVQVNTTITRRNVAQVERMGDLLATLDIVLWSVFFLIPVGRGLAEERIAPAEYEEVFGILWDQAQKQNYGVKTTEAHHYRRYVLRRRGNPQHQPGTSPDSAPTPLSNRIQRAPLGVNDGKGVIFVSHTGSVFPSGFMPILCGKFPEESVVDVYRNSPLLQSLREGDLLKGKCGCCEYRSICGGSRARAYAVTHDPLGAEPDCIYQPSA